MKVENQSKAVETIDAYNACIERCENIFLKKTTDYGTAWRVLRTIAIVDQLYIKAQRIRTIQESGTQKVSKLGDDISSEFIGIVNYSLIGLIQLNLTEDDEEELHPELATKLYHAQFELARDLMLEKNHDYGEAWRNMSQESFTDLILMKLQRMRQIIANKEQTMISEGLDANYLDIVNYSVFALIMISEQSPTK